jgi:hypothetical protein
MTVRDLSRRAQTIGILTAALLVVGFAGVVGSLAATAASGGGTTSDPVTLCVANSTPKVVTDPGTHTCRKGKTAIRVASAADAAALTHELDALAATVNNFVAGYVGTLDVDSGISAGNLHWSVSGAHLAPGTIVHQCDATGCTAANDTAADGTYRLDDQAACGGAATSRWWTATDYARRKVTSPTLYIDC